MFDWQDKVQFLRNNPRYNNAADSYIHIVPTANSNWFASIYQLTSDEAPPQPEILLDVLCKQNERQSFRAVNWGWDGMTPQERNATGAIFADKPDNEIKIHPILGRFIWLEISGGDRIEHINDQGVNVSYLVLFQEAGAIEPEPTPDPEPDPTPEPEPIFRSTLTGELTVAPSGKVTIILEGKAGE